MTAPFEIALVTDRWDPGGGGREQYLRDLEAALTGAGGSVRVFCRTASDGTSAGVPVSRGARGLRRRLAAWRQEHAGAPILASHPVAAATHYQLHDGLYRDAYAAEAESFGPGWRRRLYRPALAWNRRRRALLRAQEDLLSAPDRPRLMVWSRALGDRLSRSYGIPSAQIRVCPPGVDASLFRPAGPDRQDEPGGACVGRDLRLLFVAHNFQLKGLSTILAALRESRRGGLRANLSVAGAGPIRQFRAAARRLEVADDVAFLGKVPRARLAELYRRSDALVHPTFYDPCSLVALEALASGCPIVTTRRNGASELIEEGGGLLLEDPADAHSLARCLEALADPPSRAALRRRAAAIGREIPLAAHVAEVMGWLGVASGAETGSSPKRSLLEAVP